MINSTIASCPRYSGEIQQEVDPFKQWIIGIIRPTVGLLGILGNGIIPMIILRKDMRNTFNKLLGGYENVSFMNIKFSLTHFDSYEIEE